MAAMFDWSPLPALADGYDLGGLGRVGQARGLSVHESRRDMRRVASQGSPRLLQPFKGVGISVGIFIFVGIIIYIYQCIIAIM
jgi:hypothetical protein